MSFIEVVDRVIELLRNRGRLTYRVLKREFNLDDEQLEELKEELLFSHTQVKDEGGRGLVWTGDQEEASPPSSTPSQSQTPASYTPPHIAERILAEQAAMESRGATRTQAGSNRNRSFRLLPA